MAHVIGQSVTISEPTKDRLWTVLQRGHLTLESGGSFDIGTQVTIAQTSSYTITGGNTERAITSIAQGSTVIISGGKISGEWTVAQASKVTVQGTGLVLTKESFGIIQHVTGTLKDGTPIDQYFQVATNQDAQIIIENS